MNEQLSTLETELQKYILNQGYSGERILGRELLKTGSKTAALLKSLFISLLVLAMSLLTIFVMKAYALLGDYFSVLLAACCVLPSLLLLKLRHGSMLLGDYPATYFVVTTHGVYLCVGLHCCFIFTWSFDELSMLEYGAGKVRATSKYWMADARKYSNNKALKKLYKRNLKHLRKKEPVERRIFSFSDTFVRPPESMPGRGPIKTNRSFFAHANRPYYSCSRYLYSADAPKMQTYILRFSPDSEMPELCRKAASQYRKIKIEKL